jgi:hypothetical protein
LRFSDETEGIPMRTFENLIGDTDTYVRGDGVGIKLHRLSGVDLAHRRFAPPKGFA